MTDQELIERVAKEVMGWEPTPNDGRMWMQNSKVVYWRKPWPNSGDDQWNPLEHIDYMDMVLERMRELRFPAFATYSDEWSKKTAAYWSYSDDMQDSHGNVDIDGTDITATFRALLLAALREVESHRG